MELAEPSKGGRGGSASIVISITLGGGVVFYMHNHNQCGANIFFEEVTFTNFLLS